MIERITDQIMLTTDAAIQRGDVRDIVRKTIEAMHEPTDEMVSAGYDTDGDLTRAGHADCETHWRAMIDRALER